MQYAIFIQNIINNFEIIKKVDIKINNNLANIYKIFDYIRIYTINQKIIIFKLCKIINCEKNIYINTILI